jgi:hypothetical protein
MNANQIGPGKRKLAPVPAAGALRSALRPSIIFLNPEP